MVKILFVCHGNICRSPMAEFVMKDMAAKAGQAERFEIASAATSTEEIGNPVYPACTAQAGRAWHRLCGKNRPPDDAAGLRALRSSHRHGPQQPAQHAAVCGQRPSGKGEPVDGPHRPPRRCGRPVVHRRF